MRRVQRGLIRRLTWLVAAAALAYANVTGRKPLDAHRGPIAQYEDIPGWQRQHGPTRPCGKRCRRRTLKTAALQDEGEAAAPPAVKRLEQRLAPLVEGGQASRQPPNCENGWSDVWKKLRQLPSCENGWSSVGNESGELRQQWKPLVWPRGKEELRHRLYASIESEFEKKLFPSRDGRV
ncbi:hypothetical protein EDD18DRAFT_1108603 [Armillaria luteobubalina]|uniref:Uncharacterized protein n=1 Tax=Armillaria luteobubalina TaxID=153913 RepID=A0AA39Q0A1_9AGAR|nr:hypothetical protein EDD18DRAFT_1108603 [Armillaria luteobubalina]